MSYDQDVIVIGAGAGGLTAAGLSGSLGAKTMLVEKDRMGGDCTWTGCVPSKTLLAESKRARDAAQYTDTDVSDVVDFTAIMERIDTVRQDIYEEADSPQALEKFGVQTVSGHASFLDSHTISIQTGDDTREVTARFIIIATGASPNVPPIDGLSDIRFHTSESIFDIDDQPDRLGIIGGGPIGIEMAQAFNNLGSEVHVLQADDTILSRSDKRLAGTLQHKLKSEGVHIHTDSRVSAVAEAKEGVTIMTDTGDNVAVDELLVAVGRSPNTAGLDLSAAGIQTEQGSQAIMTGSRGQTSQSHIYAIGDVISGPRFTHLSEQQAKLAVFRALYKLPLAHDKPLPRVTYTDPELAEVGMIGRELDKEGVDYDTYTFPYDKLDRAITDNKATGRIKVWAEKGAGSILGAAVLGERAGELIGEFALAIEHNLSLRDISQTMHPYPTYGLGVRRLADQYLIQNQPSWLLRAFNSVFGYRGDVFMPDEGDVI